MPEKILIAKDEASFYKKSAQLVSESAVSSVQERKRFSIALSGGSTPKKLFSQLVDPYYKERLPWNSTTVFWSDERCVPSDHAESNYRMAFQTLLSHVSLPPKNVFRIPVEMASPFEAAKAYEQSMRLFFKTDGLFPVFDLILLGVGEDGHTASLFPNTTALTESLRWVAANFVEKLSSHRITLTLPVINNARSVLFLCCGQSKAAILKEIFREDLAQDRYPAQMVKPTKGELTWLLDEAAASKLPARIRDKTVRV